MTGKWECQDVPKCGWVCDDIEDSGEQRNTCEMCESASIRYIHHMTHADYPDTLLVGCVCAGNMEGSPESASIREKNFKRTARRRANWLGLSGWRRSHAGNVFINKDGLNVVIFQRCGHWQFRIEHRRSGVVQFSNRRYGTEPSAQLAAFDAVVWLRARGWPGSQMPD